MTYKRGNTVVASTTGTELLYVNPHTSGLPPWISVGTPQISVHLLTTPWFSVQFHLMFTLFSSQQHNSWPVWNLTQNLATHMFTFESCAASTLFNMHTTTQLCNAWTLTRQHVSTLHPGRVVQNHPPKPTNALYVQKDLGFKVQEKRMQCMDPAYYSMLQIILQGKNVTGNDFLYLIIRKRTHRWWESNPFILK